MVFNNCSINWFSKLSYIAHATSHVESCSYPETASTRKEVPEISKKVSQKSKPTASPPKEFFRLCRNEEWSLFAQKCEDEPHNLFWVGSQGQNLLHYICTRRPTKHTIVVFVNIFPEALEKEDEDGCLPIHIAMANGASHKVLSFMIQKAQKTILKENKWHYKPFDWIWRRCKYELLNVEQDDVDEEEIWNTIHVMIQAASQQSGILSNEGTILHKAMDFTCPLDLVQVLISKFPYMCAAKDPMGLTPLARALASSHTPSKELIQALLQGNPDVSFMKDDDGRTPLHLGIINHITWNNGLHEIFKASPQCLLDGDPVTSLFPYQLIASYSDEKESSFDLNDIFKALINSPGLLSREK